MDNDLTHLRNFITTHYTLEELNTLCFDLGLRHDALPGQDIQTKTRELLLHLGRHHRFLDLLATLERDRPDP
ncbi:MAG: hypothetical protein L0332_32485, partial [Chloroflexi bacterium]|nr:hypothetical protein [Chloroflexota bacterium]MCI0731421.1 hypothetical protein [Chloroflexota bacterium]